MTPTLQEIEARLPENFIFLSMHEAENVARVLADDIRTLLSLLQQGQRWIPIWEKEPVENQWIVGLDKDGLQRLGSFGKQNRIFYMDDDLTIEYNTEITHYIIIPEQPN